MYDQNTGELVGGHGYFHRRGRCLLEGVIASSSG